MANYSAGLELSLGNADRQLFALHDIQDRHNTELDLREMAGKALVADSISDIDRGCMNLLTRAVIHLCVNTQPSINRETVQILFRTPFLNSSQVIRHRAAFVTVAYHHLNSDSWETANDFSTKEANITYRMIQELRLLQATVIPDLAPSLSGLKADIIE